MLLEALVDEQVGPVGVRHDLARLLCVAVAIEIVRRAPVLHLAALGERIVDDLVTEPVAPLRLEIHEHARIVRVERIEQPRRHGSLPHLDHLGLDAVVGRQHAAVLEVESGAVHAELVVEEDEEVLVPGGRAGGEEQHRDGNRRHGVTRWALWTRGAVAAAV